MSSKISLNHTFSKSYYPYSGHVSVYLNTKRNNNTDTNSNIYSESVLFLLEQDAIGCRADVLMSTYLYLNRS